MGKGTPRLFVDGRFQTPDGRARMVPTRPRGPADATDRAFPMALNTGRVRDQWHTMTRTGLAPDLCRHAPEPYVEIHPDDAEALGLKDGALARVITARGEAVALAKVTDRQRRGGLFMPMHWTDAFAPSGRANALVAPTCRPDLRPAGVQAHPRPGPRLSRDLEGLLPDPVQPGSPGGGWTSSGGVSPRTPASSTSSPAGATTVERDALRKALTKGLAGELVTYEDAATGARREAWVAMAAWSRCST
jgi:assimilatory nitrate reductase catalytic subunit